MNRLRCRLLASAAVPGLVAAMGSVAHAGSNLPTGGQVVGGAATIGQTSATQMQITSTTGRSAISWNDFSIGSGYGVNVTQPTGGTQLEQVRGTNVSQIFGSLTSNGSIVIANPNGIWFGASAQVDVAGLTASTAHATAADIQNFENGGSLNLSQPGSANAAVVNQGNITISNAGLAAFVAPGVRNDGIIQAKLGTVQLSSGTTATLDFYGDGLVSIAVTGQTLAQAIDPSTGKALGAAVTNTGTLNADGGTVLVTANVASNVVDNVINTAGVVQARSVSVEGGQIVLDGGSTGTVQVAGTVDASGTGAGQTGGSVTVLGQTVNVASNTTIDASGDQGGGTISIGGGPHGHGTAYTASTVTVSKGATLKANAITAGNGGTVAIWSAQFTSFDGTIEAMGGAQGGNGGFVETSGAKLTVGGDATVNTSAMRGQSGLWLLDPTNWNIEASGGDETGAQVVTALAGGNVVIQADNTITVGDTIDSSAQSNTNTLTLESPTLDLNAAITLGVNQALTGTATTVNINPGALIQNGVDAAASGATLNVAAGTYQQQLSIDKSLTLAGDGASNTTIEAPATLGTSFSTWVTFDGTENVAAVIGVTNNADVTIKNLTVDGLGDGNNYAQFVGIGANNASLTVTGVHVTNIENTPFDGSQSGIGIGVFNEDNTSRSVTLTGNTIDNFQKDGISLQGGSLSVDVENNTVTGAGATSTIGQNGIELLGFADNTYITPAVSVTGSVGGTVSGNVVSDIGYTPTTDYATPIYILGANNVTVSGNTVTGTGGSVSAFGISILGSSNITVENNVLSDLARGISVGDEIDGSFFPSSDSNIAISGGSIENSATGVYVDPNYASDVTVSGVNFANNTIHYQGSGTGVPTVSDVLANNTFDGTAVDPTNLPNTIYGSLQAAVNADVAGGTLDLNGTFREQVVLSKDMTLDGSGEATTTIESPSSLPVSFTSSGGPNYAVVLVENGANATIENLTVDGRGKGDTNYRFDGIAFDDASGTIDTVHITRIRNGGPSGTLNGAQSGDAVYAYDDNASPQTVTLENSQIDDFQKNGVTIDGVGLTGDVSGNTITGAGSTILIAQNGVQYSDGAVGEITDNTISGFDYSPASYAATEILLYDAGSGITISGNSVTGPAGSEGSVALYVYNDSLQTQNLTISGNTFNTGGEGVIIGASSGDTIKNNTIENFSIASGTYAGEGYGIDIFGGSANTTIKDNLITANDTGVLVEGGAYAAGTGTVLIGNSLAENSLAALENDSSTFVDAAGNWWGTTDPTQVTITGAGAADVDFNAMLASGTPTSVSATGFDADLSSLIVHTLGATNGVTGRITEALSLVTSGGTITVTAGSYTENVSVGATPALDDLIFAGATTLDGTLDSSNAALTEFDGTFTATSVTTGAAAINGGSVNTTDGQTYSGAITLGPDSLTLTTLTDSGGSPITFESTVDGPGGLVTQTSGMTTFDGFVGRTTPIEGLLVLGGPTTFDINTPSGSSVVVDGATVSWSPGDTFTDVIPAEGLGFAGPVTLDTNTVLTAEGNGNSVVVNGESVFFGSSVDAATAGGASLTVNSPTTFFEGTVGGTYKLSSLTVTGTGGETFFANASANVYSVNTTGDQVYGNAANYLSGEWSFAGGTVSFAKSLTASTPPSEALGFTTIVATPGTLSVTGGFTWVFPGTGSVDSSGANLTVFDGVVTLTSLTTGAAAIDGTYITTTGDQTYSGGISLGADALLEATGAGATITFDGGAYYDSNYNLAALATGDIDVYGPIQNGGAGAISLVAGWDGVTPPTGETAADIATLLSGTNTYGQNSGSVTIDGSNGLAAVGSAGGTTTVAGYNVTLNGGNDGAQIGFFGPATGAINVLAVNNVKLTGGGSEGAFAQIGHGGYAVDQNATGLGDVVIGGDINVSAGAGVVVQGGTNSYAYAQIGHGGGYAFSGASLNSLTISSSVGVTAGGDVTLSGGNSEGAYAQIGHGGFDFASGASSTGAVTISGDASVGSGGSVSLAGGSGDAAYAQIGHGGAYAFEDASLDSLAVSGTVGVTVSAPGASVSLDGTNAGSGAYSQIGHGGIDFADGAQITGAATIDGDITVSATNAGVTGGGVTLTGGDSDDAYAQIGHGGAYAFDNATLGSLAIGGTSANITVTADGDIVLQAGGSSASYAQIGHGGIGFAEDLVGTGTDFGTSTYVPVTSASLAGDITVTSNYGSVSVRGGNGYYFAYAQIGHGGAYAFGDSGITALTVSGEIAVTASGAAIDGDVTVKGGSGYTFNYGQIGNGGAEFGANANSYNFAGTGTAKITGDITVTSSNGAVNVYGGDGYSFAYAQIGHGGSEAFANSGFDTLTIGADGQTITVSAEGDVNVSGGSGYTFNYAQIGNGGAEFAMDSVLGSASIQEGISLTSSTGNIYVEGAFGGYTFADYAQIGHGGAAAFYDASTTGDLSVTGVVAVTANDGYIYVYGGGYTFNYAQIGHGGVLFGSSYDLGSYGLSGGSATFSDVTLGGNITVSASNGYTYAEGGGGGGSYSQIGHGGGYAFDGASLASLAVSGNITVNGDADGVGVYGGYGFASYAQIGHGGYAFAADSTIAGAATIDGNIGVTSADSMIDVHGESGYAYAQIGHGGTYAFANATLGSLAIGDTAANITVSGTEIDVQGGYGFASYAQIGHGGAFFGAYSFSSATPSLAGDISVTSSTGDVNVTGGSDGHAFAQIGHGGGYAFSYEPANYSGLVTVSSGGALTVTSRSSTDEYAAIGLGDPTDFGTLLGTVDVTSVGDQTYIDPNGVILAGGTYGTAGSNLNFWTDSSGLTLATVTLSGSITIDNSNTFWGPVTLGSGVSAPNVAFSLSGQNTEFSGQVANASSPVGNMSISGGDNFTIDPGIEVYVTSFSDSNMSGTLNFGSTLNVSGKLTLSGNLSGDITCSGGGFSCLVLIPPASGTLNGVPVSQFLLVYGTGTSDNANYTLHLPDYEYALSNPGESLGSGGVNPQAGCSEDEKKANGGSCPAGSNSSEQSSVNFANQFLGGHKL